MKSRSMSAPGMARHRSWARSPRVYRWASRCRVLIRPVNATGWYAMALTASTFCTAKFRISPIWSLFTPLRIVGTRQIFMPVALQFSTHASFLSHRSARRSDR